mmetsp:Transcript_23470/g.61484  ORF Transcript_23470/g.61484 Transcript_23470/m.61484 type:complete len:132 (+) Transcript_23470:93-488(+)
MWPSEKTSIGGQDGLRRRKANLRERLIDQAPYAGGPSEAKPAPLTSKATQSDSDDEDASPSKFQRAKSLLGMISRKALMPRNGPVEARPTPSMASTPPTAAGAATTSWSSWMGGMATTRQKYGKKLIDQQD